MDQRARKSDWDAGAASVLDLHRFSLKNSERRLRLQPLQSQTDATEIL